MKATKTRPVDKRRLGRVRLDDLHSFYFLREPRRLSQKDIMRIALVLLGESEQYGADRLRAALVAGLA